MQHLAEVVLFVDVVFPLAAFRLEVYLVDTADETLFAYLVSDLARLPPLASELQQDEGEDEQRSQETDDCVCRGVDDRSQVVHRLVVVELGCIDVFREAEVAEKRVTDGEGGACEQSTAV